MLADRVLHTTTTTGTGSYDLVDPTDPLYLSAVASVGSGSRFTYAVEFGGAWELCDGVVTAGSPATLTRNLIRSSTGALINWGAGTKTIYSLSQADLQRFGAVGAVPTAGGTANALTVTHLPPMRIRRVGMEVNFVLSATNTGNMTLNVDTLGNDPLRRADASEVPPGLAYAGLQVKARWDGTQWRAGPELNTGDMLLPGSGAVTAVAGVDILLPAQFNFFEFDLSLFLATDTAQIAIRTSTNGGSSFDSGGSDYQIARAFHTTSTTWTADGPTLSFIPLNPGTDNDSASSVLVQGRIVPGGGGRHPLINSFAGGVFDLGAGAYPGVALHNGRRVSTTRINAIRFFATGGTFTGRISVRGRV